jgi:peptidoglycan/LPS O-acetylase OafA/YrhL
MGDMHQISSGHLQRIDNLRGVAIAAVVLFHFHYAIHFHEPQYHGFWFDFHGHSALWWLLYPLSFGGNGVALFFVISGYVIHRSYLLDRRFNWSAYASRRFWRIFPTYFLVLACFSFGLSVSLASKDFILHALLVHNLTDDTFFGSINPSFWSLAVECQLYAMYPLALFLRTRFGVRGMLTFGCIASAFWTIGAYTWVDLSASSTWLSPIALWPDWLLGAAIAEYHLAEKCLFKHPFGWALCSGILLILSSWSRLTSPLGFSLASLASAALVDVHLTSKKSWADHSMIRRLGLLGICSYSVYLIHQPLILPFISALSELGVVGLEHPTMQIVIGCPLFFILIFGLGWVLYVLVEKRGQQLGKLMAQRHVSTAFHGQLLRQR